MKTSPLRSSNLSPVGMVPSSPFARSTICADQFSPIASSPRNSFKLPAVVSLNNFHQKFDQPEITPEVPEESSWTSSLFSPVLKLFATDSSNISEDSTDNSCSEIKMVEDESSESKTASDKEDDMVDDELGFYEFDPFVFMAQLPAHQLVKNNVQDPRPLPPLLDGKKPTLILDLDETLVHCSADSSGQYDVTFGVHFNGTICQVYVRKRPHLDIFLEAVAAKFEVVVFTASQRIYAERLLDILDPQKRLVHHRLYRESCLMVAGNLMKDLSILDRDLKKTVIVDNSPHAFGYQLDNGIPIESWYEDPHDVELLKLLPLLDHLYQVDDVRPHLRKTFGMVDHVNEARCRC